MGKEVGFLYGILIMGLAFMSFVYAEGNNTGNVTCTANSDCYPAGFVPASCGTFYVCTNNTCVTGSNYCQNQSNFTCTEDDDCSTGYECEDKKCVLDDDDEDNNETDDDDDSDDNETEEEDGCEWQCGQWGACSNGTATRTCTNANNCTGETPKQSKSCNRNGKREWEKKVCCKSTETNENNETKIEYEIEDRTSCLEDDEDEVKEIVNNSFCRVKVNERQRIKFEERTGQDCTEGCTCRGVVMTCEIEGGREMTVFTSSGNIVIQIQGVNVTTNVTLYKVNDTIVGNFTRGERRIFILPDEARERIKEKIKTRFEGDDDLTLNNEGFYEVEGKKKARLFWIFSVREHVRAEVDAEDGEVKVRNPWWGFLANDKEEN